MGNVGYAFDIPEITVPETVFLHLRNDQATNKFAFAFFYNGAQIASAGPYAVNNIVNMSGSLGGKQIDMLRLYVASGAEMDLTITPMFMAANIVSAFVPYANVCPISGQTGAVVCHSGEDTSDPDTCIVDWQSAAGTVYGGTLNVISGELVVDRALIASYSGESLPSTWISDRDAYAAGTTPSMGAQVVYRLPEPVTFQLEPHEFRTLHGQNRIWADTGDSAVTYAADLKLYIDKKIAGT